MTGELCIGLMAGTSLDGIDVAIVRIDGHAAGAMIDLVAFDTIPYPDHVRAELLDLYDNQDNAIARLCSLNAVVGECFGDAAIEVAGRAGIDLATVRVIGSHGQTVWHQPAADPTIPITTPSTLQIGEPSVIAARTGVPVMADFRVADMAVGGQGAPLAPYFDWAIMRHPSRNRVVQNIGGIGNLTWLPAGCGVDDVIAFDTGPGNMLIDGLVSRLSNDTLRFDLDGRIALSGNQIPGLLDHLLEDGYLAQPPPKTTGREYYDARMVERLLADTSLHHGDLHSGDPFVRQRAADLVATVTAFTARSIAQSCARWLPQLPDELLVNGGGSRNPALMAMIAGSLPGIDVRATDDDGINADAKEAMAFALLAHDGLAGHPTNIPRATGATRAVTLGKLIRL
jgi:anhydro-N-acetylmuramic acid kinase